MPLCAARLVITIGVPRALLTRAPNEREAWLQVRRAIMRRVHPAAVSVRPYRPVDCLMVSARLALAWGETRSDIERVMLVQTFIAALDVDELERQRVTEVLAASLGPRSVKLVKPSSPSV
jgi:hypothetical protein